jgi:4-hydroxy-tetrahydrodipicolinate synthase
MSLLSVESCYESLRYGLIPAVPVTCGAAGQVDEDAQNRYIAHMTKQGVVAVAVWAHTGRGLHLGASARIQVLRAWARGLGSGKLLIAGAGGSPQHAADAGRYIDSALRMADDALENGAHALLAYPPTAFRQSSRRDEQVFEYHRQLASRGAPLILFYLYEAAGGISYSLDLLRELFALPQVVGIKLATLDSVMTFQDVATLIEKEFPTKLLITGEDRFFGYSLMCGAQAALIGMGATCTQLQCDFMHAYFQGRTAEFVALSRSVDLLGQALFRAPMEGYIRRALQTMVYEGVIPQDASYDPWGPPVPEREFAEIAKLLRELPQATGKGAR